MELDIIHELFSRLLDGIEWLPNVLFVALLRVDTMILLQGSET